MHFPGTGILSAFRECFPTHLQPQMKELYATIAILNFGLSAITLFEPIYLFILGFPIWQILLSYGLLYLLYFILMPLGGKVVKKKGFAHSILYGSFFLVLYYICLFAVSAHHGFIIPAMIFFAIQKTLFWAGYHSDFVFFSQKGQQARQVSNIQIISALIVVLGPLFGGLIISFFGFPVLFLLVCVIILLSNIPILLTQEVFEPTEFSYWDTYRTFFAKGNRRNIMGQLGFGEELIAQTVWPIFMFVTLSNIAKIGSVAAFSVAATSFILLYAGRKTDIQGGKGVMRLGITGYIVSWLSRLLILNGLGVLAIDFLSRTTKEMIGIPVISYVYRQALEKNAIVNTVIHFEMGLVVGKIITCFIAAFIFAYIPNPFLWAFLVGCLFTLFYFFFRTEKYVEA